MGIAKSCARVASIGEGPPGGVIIKSIESGITNNPKAKEQAMDSQAANTRNNMLPFAYRNSKNTDSHGQRYLPKDHGNYVRMSLNRGKGGGGRTDGDIQAKRTQTIQD